MFKSITEFFAKLPTEKLPNVIITLCICIALCGCCCFLMWEMETRDIDNLQTQIIEMNKAYNEEIKDIQVEFNTFKVENSKDIADIKTRLIVIEKQVVRLDGLEVKMENMNTTLNQISGQLQLYFAQQNSKRR